MKPRKARKKKPCRPIGAKKRVVERQRVRPEKNSKKMYKIGDFCSFSTIFFNILEIFLDFLDICAVIYK
jgi:hypothetical protein